MVAMKIFLKPGKEEALLRFHPWVFSGAIRSADGPVEDGDVVEVYADGGQLLGVGHANAAGSIAVRMLAFAARSIDLDFWREKLRSAYRLRQQAVLSPRTSCYRLVHGEADGLPGLIVDVYGATAVLQAHSTGMYLARHELAQALRSELAPSVAAVYDKSAATLPASMEAEDGYLWGEPQQPVVLENGLKLAVDVERGQKTGLFLDQRDSRSLAERYSAGRQVLNLFCYTGGFSAYALRGGAAHVCSVDTSADAVAHATANVALNFGEQAPHQAIVANSFDFLNDLTEKRYDMVILDPPAFAKHRGAAGHALQAYQKLNALALKKVPSGAIIFTFSCSQVVTREQFCGAVFAAALESRRSVRILHRLTQPADHPISIYHPEGEYLKGLALYVE
ncbi:MAG: class I SAM-dependent rRNA methyltransferase [Prevotellaceae bacterium]|jgi:23S rRNA (cytosine1962-C5)-methyltransferase|nr:class I SAM-dependent rRNA methyltransferase [Prevotellaceae bacterium]